MSENGNPWSIVDQGKNFKVFANGYVLVENVRGSYVHLDKPFKGKNDKEEAVAKYSIVGIMPKATHVEAKNAIVRIIDKLLVENKAGKIASDKKFIRNGDDQAKPEYENAWTISAREERAPRLRDRKGNLIDRKEGIDEINDLFQSGYWFNVLLRPWYQDNDYGKRVNAGLVGVQFVKRDETFGEGNIDDTDAWGAVEGDDDGMGSGGSEDEGL